jgi:hypothetical protein
MFLFLSCDAPLARHECKTNIRALLAPYGEPRRILIAERGGDDHAWIAVVEMAKPGALAAAKALGGSTLGGRALRARVANPHEVQMALGPAGLDPLA